MKRLIFTTMKKSRLISFAFLLIALYANAQQTSLTIDNQTPGWLSSKINYGDQMTVEKLEVTGYINADDLKFIGTLITDHSLNKRLDLSDVEIVPNNTLEENAFGIDWSSDKNDKIEYLALPINLKSSYKCLGNFFSVDTLVAGGTMMHKIEKYAFSGNDRASTNYNIEHLILRDGTDEIGTGAFGKSSSSSASNPQLRSVLFPSTMKIINERAFQNCQYLSEFNLPDGIEVINGWAFNGCAYKPDTLYLPKELKQFTTYAFNKCKVLYLQNNIESITNKYYTYNNSYNTYTGHSFIDQYNNIEIHIQSPQPPEWTYNYLKELSGCTIYVPKGSSQLYMDEDYFPGGYNAWSYARQIIEDIRVDGVKIKGVPTLHVGDEVEFKAEITPVNAINKKVIWSSSDTDVATVSNSGMITAKKYGCAQIKVITIDGAFNDAMNINVYEHTTGITLDNNLEIKIGEKKQLKAKTIPVQTSDGEILWYSSDTDIATVDNTGIVKGEKQGICEIIATSVDGGYNATCQVKVLQPLTNIQLDKHEVTIKTGSSFQLNAITSPNNADNKKVLWSSDNNNVATVSIDGIVVAQKAGEATIMCKSAENEDINDICKVTVIQPVTGINLNENELTLHKLGETVQLIANVQPEDASNKTVRWSSSKEDVCSISDNGTLVTLSNGVSIITATTVDGGFVAVCIVNVDTTSGIENINITDKEQIDSYYTIDGRRINALQKGLNIVRLKNGNIKKIFVKDKRIQPSMPN